MSILLGVWFLIGVSLRGDEVIIAARVAVIFADTMVIAVTWMKTYRHIRVAQNLQMRVSTSVALLTDGAF